MKVKFKFGNEYDSSQNKGVAIDVFYIHNEEEVIDVIKYAKKNKLKVTPRGSGTSLTGSSVPNNSVVINTSKMNKILEINRNKNYVVVEPGIILDDLNYELRKIGKFFPIIPSSHGIATLGGMVSCNAAGKESIAYGKTLDWVEELELVDADGNLVKLNKIPQYTEGMLGIITKIKLKITDYVEEKSYDLFEFDNYKELIKKVKEIKELNLKNKNVLSLEGVGFYAAKFIGKEKNLLFVYYKDDTGKYKNKLEIFERRDALYSLLSSNGFTIIEDPQIDLEKILDYLDEYQIPWFGHLGVDIVHPCFNDFKLAEDFMKYVEMNKGIVSGEHGYGLLKKNYRPRKEIEDIKKIKKETDKENIFNPWLLEND
ncbi:MAG: FAD-binding oxidoreductase [Candidatus Woesearchaeota archaeon]